MYWRKKTSVHSIQCHCQGRLVLSSINYCLKKCLGEKKEEKRVPTLPLSQYVLHICIRVPKLFPNIKGFNYHKIVCQKFFWNILYFLNVFLMSAGLCLHFKIQINQITNIITKYSKGQIKLKSRLACCRFSQKTNGRIWSVCREV